MEIIDAKFRVVGQKPPREPIIRSWRGLLWFFLAFGVPSLLSLWARHAWPFH